jgi:hypothetical protein
VHNFFWSRIPFQPAGPPIGPEEAIIDDIGKDTALPPKGEHKNI